MLPAIERRKIPAIMWGANGFGALSVFMLFNIQSEMGELRDRVLTSEARQEACQQNILHMQQQIDTLLLERLPRQ